MKTNVRVSMVAMWMMGVTAITQAAPADDISVVPSKYKNLFVFKTDKNYIGATVEVYYSNGDLVTSHKLGKRKMVINFCDTKFGEYTIRVVKGDKTQEFHYVKK